jgi:hypothetical protein
MQRPASLIPPPTGDPLRWPTRVGAVAIVVGLLALAAPVVWSAVSAGLGAVALCAIGVVGAALFQSVPLALQRLENRLLSLRKAEARSNPVEQLQNDMLRREERLQAFRRALATIGGQIGSMEQMVAERRHLDPGHVLDRQQRALDRMRHFHACNVQRLEDARVALEAFQQQVQQKVFEWEFAQAGRQVMSALNPRELSDLMQNLLTDEALRAVRDRFNEVFAELDVEMRSVDAPTRTLLADAGLDRLDALALPGITAATRSPA